MLVPNTIKKLPGNPDPLQYVVIGDKKWSLQNLDVTTYRNGDPIPEVQNFAEWETLTTGAWCYYDNDPANGPIYGKLYNWYAVNDPRGLAPEGWHIPTDVEWDALIATLGGYAIAGGAMKSQGNTLWNVPNTAASNSSGFTALPSGNLVEGGFLSINNNCLLWSSDSDSDTNAGGYILFYDREIIDRYSYPKNSGLSVRLIKDPIETVSIGAQTWTAKNLDVANFRNGTAIVEATSLQEWISLMDSQTPAWAYLYFDNANLSLGKFYNYYAINSPNILALSGFHIPSLAEFIQLKNFISVEHPGTDCNPLKEQGSTNWNNDTGTDLYGFCAQGNGYLDPTWGFGSSRFSFLGLTTSDNYWALIYNESSPIGFNENIDKWGLQVRLIEDDEFHPLIKGNIGLGVQNIGYGETQRTGYWNGKGIPNWGYIIYYKRRSPGFSAYSASNDDEMILLTNFLLGESFTTIEESLAAFANNDDVLVANINYPDIISRNLVYHIDAGFVPSYPKGGTTIYDLSGNKHHTIIDTTMPEGGLIYTPDYGGILNFPNDYGRSATSPGLGGTLDNFTIDCIVKVHDLSTASPIFIFGEKFVSTTGFGINFNIFYNPSQHSFIFYCRSGSNVGQSIQGPVIDVNDPNSDKWYNISVSFDGEFFKMYIDGSIYNETPSEINPASSGESFGIGDNDNPPDKYFSVMSIKVYDIALSDAEILQNYNAIRGRISSNIYTPILLLDASNPVSYSSPWLNLYDLSGSGLHSTLYNTVHFTPNGQPEAPRFNGDNSYGLIPSGDFNRSDGQELTVSVWIKPGKNGGIYQDIVANRDDTGLYNWMLYQHGDDGAISFHGAANQNKSSYIPTLGKWINVTVTVTSGGRCTLYVDGVQEHVNNNYHYNDEVSSELYIGTNNSYSLSEMYKGSISAVSIYTNALTADEVFYLYDSTRGYYQAIPEEIPILGTGYTLQNGNYGYIEFSTSEPDGESLIYVNWGDGNSELIQSEGGYFYYAEHYYDYSYDWEVRITAADLGVIQVMYMSYINTSSYIGLDALTGCSFMDLSGTLISGLNFHLPPNLQDLQLNSCSNLTEFNPSYALPDSITQIYLQYCINLSSFNPSQLPGSLESLQLYGCGLTSFTYDLHEYVNILNVNLEGNNIISFTDFGIFPNSIQAINLANNNMLSVDFINMPPNLESLYFYYSSGLSITNPQNLPGTIQNLSFDSCGLTDFPLSLVPNDIIQLDIRGCQLSSFVIDSVLEKLDTIGTYGGTLYCSGQTPPAPPGPAGIGSANSLIGKDWYIETD